MHIFLLGDRLTPEVHLENADLHIVLKIWNTLKRLLSKFISNVFVYYIPKNVFDIYIKHIYWNELNKACFQDKISYHSFEYLARKMLLKKYYTINQFEIWNCSYFIKWLVPRRNCNNIVQFFDKGSVDPLARGRIKSAVTPADTTGTAKQYQQLAGKLHKLIIKHYRNAPFIIYGQYFACWSWQ